MSLFAKMRVRPAGAPYSIEVCGLYGEVGSDTRRTITVGPGFASVSLDCGGGREYWLSGFLSDARARAGGAEFARRKLARVVYEAE